MKIFHHNDNDGKAAAAMVYHFIDAYGISKLSKDDFISVNYNDSIPSADKVEEKELVFIVDYSFTENTVHQLYEIAEKTENNVVWFDHHKSSLEVYDKVKDSKICKSVVIDMDRSGAKIAFDELIKNDPHLVEYYFNKNNKSNISTISNIIDLVDDYDRWIHKFPESLKFNIGSTIYDTDPMSNIWYSDPKHIIATGSIVNDYNYMKNSKLFENAGFKIKINGHDCIVLNTPESSSQAFSKYYEEYKFAIRFVFNGKNFTYSIYSGLEDIDCAEIARHFNVKGGGHKGAAGFVSDKIEFVDGMVFVI